MVSKIQKRLIIAAVFAALFTAYAPLSAQNSSERTDSLVRLLNGQSLRLIEKDGVPLRKAVKPTFLHNGTYLICDTSLWNVNEKIINCDGNVQLIQGETVLTSDHLDYLIDEDLARFRGTVVQLRNKQENILRTKNLDYNTKDSLAIFFDGASMKSEDGQIIESDRGTYSNAKSLFEFRGNVNMFTDSVFVKTTTLEYDSKIEKAYFTSYIDFWRDGKMLSAGGGWYDRQKEVFFFKNDVHGLSEEQETWSDTLYFYRRPNDVLMLGRVHVQDTSRRVAALSEYLYYQDSLSRVTMKNDAAVALWEEKNGQADTTYIGADLWIYETARKCDVPENEIREAAGRLSDMEVDAVSEYRARAAKQASEEAEKSNKNNPNRPKLQKAGSPSTSRSGDSDRADLTASSLKDEIDKTEAAPDTTKLASLDTIPTITDTTKVGFARGLGNIRIFRKDMQVRCDSLRYTDLDSIARLYKSPVVWNEGNRQYTSDSLFVLIRNNAMDRASLNSNAFIITQEDSLCFDQIKSADALAYFDKDSQLRRFDALGGVTALFYLEENETLATVNKVQAKMLSAILSEGELQNIYYFDAPKNDAYPVVQMPQVDRQMKGFNWMPDQRPKSKLDVTNLSVKASEREYYETRPKASFNHTDFYFPGYMAGVYKSLDEAKLKKESSAEPESDSLALDRPLRSDREERALIDTLAENVPAAVPDSLQAPQSVSAAADTTGTEEEYMSASEIRRALRIAKRDAKWAELDRRDAAKDAAKQAKKDERARKKAERLAKIQARQEEKDKAKLEKYIKYYEKKKARHEGKQEPEPAGERPQGVGTERELQTIDES